MSSIFQVKKVIFKDLKEHIKSKCTFSVDVKMRKVDELKDTPLVLFSEERNESFNRTTNYQNQDRIINYEINIYCKGKDCEQKIDDLSILVVEVMENKYHMEGGLLSVIPYFDDNEPYTLQANFRYTTRYNPSRLLIY